MFFKFLCLSVLGSIVASPISSRASKDAYLCTQATISMSATNTFEPFSANVTATADMTLFCNNKTLRFSNVRGYDSKHGVPMGSICYENFNNFACNKNLFVDFDFALDGSEPYLEFHGQWGSFQTPIFLGYSDNGTLSNFDGTLFSPDNLCNTKLQTTTDITSNLTTCCTQLTPAPAVSTSQASCKTFRSRTTIYNSDFSIHATSTMNYTLSGSQIKTIGEYSKASDIKFVNYVFQNQFACDSRDTSNFECTFNLPTDTDSKTFIHMNFWNSTAGIKVPQAATLLIRNGQTLMSEGVPFSPANDCQYFTYKGHADDKSSASEFCCTEFN